MPATIRRTSYIDPQFPVSTDTRTQIPLNRTLFSNELVEFGLFDCPRQHPLFMDSGPMEGYLVVFPRHAVKIFHDQQLPVVASR